MYSMIKAVCAVIFAGIICSMGIEAPERIPDNAKVCIVNGEYVGLPTMRDMVESEDYQPTELPKMITVGEAREAGYPPNETSINNGDFLGSEPSLLMHWLDRMGVVEIKKRWAPNGKWNY